MPRVKRGPKRKNRRVRVLELAKGYYGTKNVRSMLPYA